MVFTVYTLNTLGNYETNTGLTAHTWNATFYINDWIIDLVFDNCSSVVLYIVASAYLFVWQRGWYEYKCMNTYLLYNLRAFCSDIWFLADTTSLQHIC